MAKNGTKEVVLTGIHIGQWGLEWSLELVDLLYEIEKTSILRYRLGSLYINEIDDRMLEFLKKSEKFCPHFHLSLQSLCNKTLENMNRKYSSSDAIEITKKLYNTFNEPFLGCDIIAGFPDESDEDFNVTYENLGALPLSYIHAFPYSIRENTKAAAMSMQIPEETKQKRAEQLKNAAKLKYNLFIEKNINTIAEVLVEKRPDRHTGFLKGVTKNYLNVYIDSYDKSLHNTVQKVKILNTKDEKLFCTIIKE